MTFDDVSTFFRRVTLNAVNGLFVPDQVTVTARSANGLETVQSVSVVDQVNITVATWTKATGEIKIVAISSDKISPTVNIAHAR